ncbi:MAG: hypothetical protein R3263_07835, partial [Myxococcota bacterium]|nr:hypothetical protein [Myxococcota bacterium]
MLAAWMLIAFGVVLGLGLAARDPRAVPALVPGGLGYTEVQLDELTRSADARRAFLRREHVPFGARALF